MATEGKPIESLKKLVERFDEHKDHYKNSNYNETELRNEFLYPFFEALGWDVYNTKDYADGYKDVVHEDSIKVGEATKAPDICFRIGGTRKFFVEAKKPSVNIKDDISPAFQVRRYAWSAKLPISILTDFEEFAVYDCRIKPVKTDKASTGRIMYLTYKDYLEKWEELKSIFSPEAIQKGAFDKYAETHTKKRGTAEVDDEFLKEIESWRDLLARNIAIRNPDLSQRELNHSVQVTIDRIIFLRICEDRGIEDYGKLQSLLNGANVYPRMLEYYRQADEKYNSGLFHFEKETGRSGEPDTLTPSLKIDDKQLKDILKRLYYPESPYVFSEIPSDILGQVYERFLGKVIRLTSGHQARVEDKPEVRKAGGVYYTPTYIVEYIVKNTVGKLLEGKTPRQVEKLSVLDPACGSGSFLLGAYQYLLDWHRQWYRDNDPHKHAKGKNPAIYEGQGGWELTTAEKKRILLNNIYGVDIDSQAVEVTKLSLLLKVLEGETSHTLSNQMKMFHERALPDLRNNIKCGNSLIGPNFYEGKDLSLFGEDDMYRINVFGWNTEFKDIMKSGGFDAVIGNPPYARIQTLQEYHLACIPFYKEKYFSASTGNFDIYLIFVEKALQLINSNGLMSYILPHKFFQGELGINLRKIITEKNALNRVINFGANQIFSDATTYTCLLFLSGKPQKTFKYYKFELGDEIKESLNEVTPYDVSIKETDADVWNFYPKTLSNLLHKLNDMPVKLSDITRKIFVGLQTSADKIYVLKKLDFTNDNDSLIKVYSQSLDKEIVIERGLLKPFLMGKDVKKYEPPAYKSYVVFPYLVEDGKAVLMTQAYIKREFPRGWQYLVGNKTTLENRENGKMKGDRFYAYIYPKNLAEFNQIKIMTPEISEGCNMTLDVDGILYHTTKVYSFVFKVKQREAHNYFLGILNSKLLWLFLSSTGYILRGGFYTFKTQYLNPFPIRTINFDDAEDKARHDRMVEMVDSMLSLNKRLAGAKTDHERDTLKRQIDHTDHQIDLLVYELYGLTEDEIKIVEGEE